MMPKKTIILFSLLISFSGAYALFGRKDKSDCPSCKIGFGKKSQSQKIKIREPKQKDKKECKSCNTLMPFKSKSKTASVPQQGVQRQPMAAQPVPVEKKPLEKPKEQASPLKTEEPVVKKAIDFKGGELIELESREEFEKIKAGSIPAMVEVYASWCGPCKEMAPRLKKLAPEMPEIIIAKLNTDKARSVSKDYGITGYPHFLFFKDGKLVGRTSGGMGSDLMRSYIRKHLGEKPAMPGKPEDQPKKEAEKASAGEAKPSQNNNGKPAQLAEENTGEVKGGQLIEIKSKEEFAKYKNADKPVMIEIYAPWCGPCKGMVPKLEKLAKEMPQYVLAKFDGDKFKSVTKEYGIDGFPHYLFYKDGKLVGRTRGGMDIEIMRNYINKYLG